MPDCDFNDRFVKEYSKLVYTAIRNRLKKCGLDLPHEEILDIMQDTLTHIFESGKLDTIRSRDSIPYWIAIVSGNAAMQHLRLKRRAEPEEPISIFTKAGDCELIDILPCCGLSPSEELDRGDLSEKLDSALESLPDRERLIIKLNLLHDKKYEEISEILNIPIGTVSNYIKRAKDKLKKALKGFV